MGQESDVKQLHVCGINYSVLDVGHGPAIVLLHGFPNDHTVWKHQIPVLQSKGYRVVAPDLRGSGKTDKPQAPDTYALRSMVADVAGIMDALKIDKAAIVGHDWGAMLAWAVASALPERTSVLVAMSNGHPSGFFAHKNGYRQRQLSWYMLMFQSKPAAEASFLAPQGPVFAPPQDPPPKCAEDLKAAMQRLTEPQAATGGINWYRGNVSADSFTNKEGALVNNFPEAKIRVPTLGIMPNDEFLCNEQMEGSGKFVEPPGSFRYQHIDCNCHFFTLEAPDETNKLLLDFFKEHEAEMKPGKQQ